MSSERYRCTQCDRSAETFKALQRACRQAECMFMDGDDRGQIGGPDYYIGEDWEWHKRDEKPTPDPINPDHYRQGGIECIDAIQAATIELTGEEAYCTGCAIKYLWRWKRKGGHEDLRKARWYLNRIIGD